MKVSILNTSDIGGGAAKAAYRLKKGLERIDLNSYYLVLNKKTKDKNTFTIKTALNKDQLRIFNFVQNRLINKNRTDISNTAFSIPYPGYDIAQSRIIQESDAINLHWINKFQSVETIDRLLSLNKPVIWTLHDQWLFTGGCHYSAGCDGYKSDCYDCHQIKNNSKRLPFYILKLKKKYVKQNLTVVTPSKWLKMVAEKSALLKGIRIEHIPNSLETDVFNTKNKKAAKSSLNLKPESLNLLFGCQGHTEKRKGFGYLLNAIRICLQDEKIQELIRDNNINILTFGNPTKELKKLKINTVSLGYVSSDIEMANIYSAADIFILPSLEDNLPNTMIESLACSTPVIASNTGGIPEAVIHGRTGLLAGVKNEKELAKHIMTLMFNNDLRETMGKNGRELIEKEYHLEIQARRYFGLFKELINKNNLEKLIKKQDKQKEKDVYTDFNNQEIIVLKNKVDVDPIIGPIYEYINFKSLTDKEKNNRITYELKKAKLDMIGVDTKNFLKNLMKKCKRIQN